MSFFRPTYSMKEINDYMAHVERLRQSADRNATLYRQSQVKQPDGSIRRNEAYAKLHEQDLHNLSIANMTLERILSRVPE